MIHPLNREIEIEPTVVQSVPTELDGQHPRFRVLAQPPSDRADAGW
jgi:hypothetical protein